MKFIKRYLTLIAKKIVLVTVVYQKYINLFLCMLVHGTILGNNKMAKSDLH